MWLLKTPLVLFVLAAISGAERVAKDVSLRTERIPTRVGSFEVRAETGKSPGDDLRRMLAGEPTERTFFAGAP